MRNRYAMDQQSTRGFVALEVLRKNYYIADELLARYRSASYEVCTIYRWIVGNKIPMNNWLYMYQLSTNYPRASDEQSKIYWRNNQHLEFMSIIYQHFISVIWMSFGWNIDEILMIYVVPYHEITMCYRWDIDKLLRGHQRAIGELSASYWQAIDVHSLSYRNAVNRQSIKCRRTIDQPTMSYRWAIGEQSMCYGPAIHEKTIELLSISYHRVIIVISTNYLWAFDELLAKHRWVMIGSFMTIRWVSNTFPIC